MAPKKTQKVNRDAGTGKFVSDEYAKHHPKTTVTETIQKPPTKKPGPKKK
jgi:hypothetical protein